MPVERVNGIDLYYEMEGDGEAVVFIHGLGSSSRDWEQQMDFFAEQFRVVALDLRGHGRSEKPPGPYSMKMFAGDTAELIKTLDLGAVHVVGISLGGMVAFQLALDSPDSVKSLVIINSGPEVVARTLRERWQVFVRRAIVQFLGMRRMGEVLSERLFPKAEQAELRAVFVERWAENNPKAYMATLNAIVGWSVAKRIGEIEARTLVISADQDYTPVADKEAYVTQMQNAELVVIEDARHAVTVERPKAVNEAVMGWLINS
ncbi:MAG: alpha/beta hydrolase [Candidatus Promineifilaceae bacterium]